jgi:hypothetical protein
MACRVFVGFFVGPAMRLIAQAFRELKSGIRPEKKKAGRSWHHHSRALRRRSMGQGG